MLAGANMQCYFLLQLGSYFKFFSKSNCQRHVRVLDNLGDCTSQLTWHACISWCRDIGKEISHSDWGLRLFLYNPNRTYWHSSIPLSHVGLSIFIHIYIRIVGDRCIQICPQPSQFIAKDVQGLMNNCWAIQSTCPLNPEDKFILHPNELIALSISLPVSLPGLWLSVEAVANWVNIVFVSFLWVNIEFGNKRELETSVFWCKMTTWYTPDSWISYQSETKL